MFSELVFRGPIISTKSSEFEGKTSQAIQLLKRTSKGSSQLLSVKLLDGADLRDYPEGKHVEVAVDVGTYQDNVYYKMLPTTAKPDAKPEARGAEPARPAAAKT